MHPFRSLALTVVDLILLNQMGRFLDDGHVELWAVGCDERWPLVSGNCTATHWPESVRIKWLRVSKSARVSLGYCTACLCAPFEAIPLLLPAQQCSDNPQTKTVTSS